MRHFARKIAVFYLALLFMGKKYQERVKNSFATPNTAAVGLVSAIDMALALAVLHVANGDYFSEFMNLPGHGRLLGYPLFFLVYFINWRAWRTVSQPENALGRDSRELAEKLPFFTILIVFGISMALFVLAQVL